MLPSPCSNPFHVVCNDPFLTNLSLPRQGTFTANVLTFAEPGPGCRDPSYLRRDEVPSSRLASLDTSERNYWVARVPRIIHTSHVRLSL